MDYTKRGWASEWDTVKDVLVEKWSYFFRISSFSFEFFQVSNYWLDFCFLFHIRKKTKRRSSSTRYHIFCATTINHILIRFLSLEILFGEYTLYIHFRRILLFLLVSRWTGHAVVNSCWREKEETTNERGYMDREIASGRPSAAGVSSFFDSLNGKLKRFG